MRMLRVPRCTVLFCLISLSASLSNATKGQAEDTQVVVEALDGKRVTGVLLSLSDKLVEVASPAGPIKLDRQTLKSIQFANAVPASSANQPKWNRPKLPLVLEMRDGSMVTANEMLGSSDKWEVENPSGKFAMLPNVIASVLFRSLDEKETIAWQTAKSEKRTGDEIIISRGSGNVDRVSGLINSISKESVAFDFEGQAINAPRAKLVGALWLRQPLERMQPAAKVILADGSVWLATKLAWSAETNKPELQWSTALDIKSSAPAEEILEVDLSAANVKWLAELQPLEREVAQRVKLASPISVRDKLFGPRFETSSGTDARTDRDLLFASPGDITFRVPEGFQYFSASVGRKSDGDARSQVSVEIYQGEDRLFERSLPDELTDISVNVAVSPGKRLRIVVKSDSNLAAGTKVQWTQPRFER